MSCHQSLEVEMPDCLSLPYDVGFITIIQKNGKLEELPIRVRGTLWETK